MHPGANAFFCLAGGPLLQLLLTAALIPLSCSLSTEPTRRTFLHKASIAASAGLSPQIFLPSSHAIPPPSKSTICVTGANGYIGLHCVKQLLADGYSVRAGVRSLSESKTKWLTKIATDSNALGRLSFATVNLSSVESMTDAMQGCDSLLHLASPFTLATKKDPIKDIVEPAVSGACNAVLAARKSNLRRVVTCGSIFGIVGSVSERGYDHVYTPLDTNTFSTPNGCAYAYSKKEAQVRSRAVADEIGIDLVTLNVGQVCGPALSPDQMNPSWEPFRLLGQKPQGGAVLSACVPGMVDVRDVATAHVAALGIPATGVARGYIVAAQKNSPTYVEISKIMSEILPERNLPSNVEVLPPKVQKLIVKGIGFGDGSLGELLEGVSVPIGGATLLVDLDSTVRDLLPAPRSIKTSLADWVSNQVEYGHPV